MRFPVEPSCPRPSLGYSTTTGPRPNTSPISARETHGSGAVAVRARPRRCDRYKDEDFARMAAVRQDSPTVVWVRVGNARRGALLAWFVPLIDQLVSMIEQGDPLIATHRLPHLDGGRLTGRHPSSDELTTAGDHLIETAQENTST